MREGKWNVVEKKENKGEVGFKVLFKNAMTRFTIDLFGLNPPGPDTFFASDFNRVGHPFFSKESSVLCVLLRSL